MPIKDVLVVGAGFAGSVMARQLAEAGNHVLILEQRPHIGGNAFDQINDHGILVHPYGPHIFHTNAPSVFNYLSQFTEWRFYEHRVRAHIAGTEYPFPINRQTINQVFQSNFTSEQIESFLETQRIPCKTIQTSEDLVLSSVGKTLGDLFFSGYTQKQWGQPLSALKANVVARVPYRANDDDRYFTDEFQFMPLQGYTRLFENLLDHPNIKLELATSFEHSLKEHFQHIVYTGPIDAYFDYCQGKLPYRSLRFEHETMLDIDHYQSVGTVNFPNENAFTRITEFKHLTGQQCRGTAVVREFPLMDGTPFYPIPTEENDALYHQYRQLCRREANVTFVGRLAQYRYYNMDQVVAAALKKSQQLIAGGLSWTNNLSSSALAG